MKIAVFSTKPYDKTFLESANNQFGHKLYFTEHRLTADTTHIAKGYDSVCVFVHDALDNKVITQLSEFGIKTIALRCAGFNNVDIDAAARYNIQVVRVPHYSPYAVAEHTVGLMLALDRKICRAYNRVKEGNFALNGLLGFDLHGRTAGIIGTGNIGVVTARILHGFGVTLLAHDPIQNDACLSLGVRYVALDELYTQSDIITLHCPLTHDTHHLINDEAVEKMRQGVMLINTSRGKVIDTRAVTRGLKSGKIGYLGLDVYEQEGDLFYRDLSSEIIQDDVFERLLTFPNVIVTGHQGFFTEDALTNIAQTTLANVTQCQQGKTCANLITPRLFV